MLCARKSIGITFLFIAAFMYGTYGLAQAAPGPSVRSTPAPDEEAVQIEPSDGQLRFADLYVKAVNAGDPKALRGLVAPRTLACYNSRTEPYLTNWLTRQAADRIPRTYSITVQKYEESEIPPSALFTLPVPPTHQMNISTTIDGKTVVLGRPIAYQDGQWYETPPCPTDLGMEKFLSHQGRSAREAEQLDTLYSKLKDPMLSDLKKMIGENRIGDACTQYAMAEKLDFVTACKVVKRLAASMGIVVK